jgi:hypothetical protein
VLWGREERTVTRNDSENLKKFGASGENDDDWQTTPTNGGTKIDIDRQYYKFQALLPFD